MSELAVALEPLAEEDVREKRAKAPESILRLRFGFTAAEARVAGQLAEGLSTPMLPSCSGSRTTPSTRT